MHIRNTEIFYFIIVQLTLEPEIRFICLSMWMYVQYLSIWVFVKDVDLEAMPASIFLNDGDDDDEDWRLCRV